MKKVNKYEKRLDSLLEESVRKTSIKKKRKLTEAFKPTDDTTMIMIGGHPDDSKKYYPWYLNKIDSTHFSMANNEKALGSGAAMVSHVGQHRGEDYYNDIVKWLHGKLKSKDIFGKKYSGVG